MVNAIGVGTVLQPASAGKSADTSIADFRDWLTQYEQGGISSDRRAEVEKNATSFEDIMSKASAQNADADPQSFISSLSTAELATLQGMHSLADPINPATLSKEGALNLFKSPGDLQDIDHDGFQMVGLAKTWQFPPVDAPDSVKQAWDKTTDGLSGSDKMLLEGSFLPITINADGQPTNNAYISPDADYSSIVQKVLDSAQFGKKYDEPWQHETRDKQISLLQDLLSNLQTA